MYKKILIFLILSTIGSVLFAQDNKTVSKETYYMAEDFDILRSEKRDKYLEFFPEEYEDPEKTFMDPEFGDYDEFGMLIYRFWFDFVPNKRLYVQKIAYEEICMLYEMYPTPIWYKKNYSPTTMTIYNNPYYYAWDREKNHAMSIYCSPYLFVLGDYIIKENEIEFDLWALAKDYQTDNIIIKKGIQFSNDDANEHSAKLVFDGDYVNFYIDDIFIYKFCRINKSSLAEYENLMRNNECDLSKVKWPRHADGTSDYDNNIIMPESNRLIEDVQKMFPKKN